MSNVNKENDLIDERGSDYGPWQSNMKLLGELFQTMIQMHAQDMATRDGTIDVDDIKIPDWLAAKMMAAMKMLRSCYPKYYLDDNYRDEANYTRFAEELQKEALPASPRCVNETEKNLDPTVKLVSHTYAPVETLCHLWDASREEGEVKSVEDMLHEKRMVDSDSRLPDTHKQPHYEHNLEAVNKRQELFLQILDAGIPVAENVSFTFMLDNVSIALREQMVRHRIGAKVGDRVGMDHAPDLSDSSWWSQSMRILNMGEFADRGKYVIPDTVNHRPTEYYDYSGGDDQSRRLEALEVYESFMHKAQEAYKALVKAGVPMEDARNVIPLAATHRISWTLNLAALKHIVGKRGCWILQLGIWKPIIVGMINALADQIDPVFRRLITPPCMKGDKYTGCKFCIDNERRDEGKDALPPCSLWTKMEEKSETHGAVMFRIRERGQEEEFDRMTEEYADLWGRNPHTGKVEVHADA